MAAFAALGRKFRRFADQESLQPDLGRGLRAAVAYMAPLLLAAAGWLPTELTFVALAAQNIAMVDVRGDYRLRLGLLVAMTAVFVGAAALGTVASGHLAAALAATALVALCGGLWRHLSSDYGMALAISSTLVFLIALASPRQATVSDHAFAALLGGLWGVLLQVANWPFRPQHPLRRTVSDSWLAVADLFEALNPADTDVSAADRERRIHEGEAALRTTLDKAYATFAATRPGPLRQRLEAVNFAAARLATRVGSLHTALGPLLASPALAPLGPALVPALTALTNTSRTVALAVVSRQPAHLATADLRLRRLANLLRVLEARLTAQTDAAADGAQLVALLRLIREHLPAVHEALRATIDRAGERAAFSLELFDLHTLTLRPLASALNLSWRVDPALVRFTLRLGVLMLAGVAIFQTFALPHGYWLPFTLVVVLQPDYGSTRLRAGQRVLGTLGGSLVASALLWLELPFAALATASAATLFAFGYFIKRNYAVAVFFITLFIVLLTETNGPVTLAFTVERLALTSAGGALALLAALFFWPVWERERFPPLLATALRANRDYLGVLIARLAAGGPYDAAATLAKRHAESANSRVFSSLQRMSGDPKNQQLGLEQAATLANGNQRLTRAFNVIALHLAPGAPLAHPELDRFAHLGASTFDALALAVERDEPLLPRLGELATAFAQLRLPVPPPAATDPAARRDRWVFGQLGRAATELGAMLLATIESAPARPADLGPAP
jgi:uncharacterized membrane protein YccC